MASTIPSTQKAVILASFPGTPTVQERPVPQEVADGEILVKVHTAGLNPVDAKIATFPWAVLSQMARLPADGEKPLVMGIEFAGEVVMVGKEVQTLKVGDRVCAQGLIGNDDASGYQQYVKLPARIAIKLPEGFSYDRAATIPVGFSTAASGLYQSAGLSAPWVGGGKGKYTGQAALVFGGSSSVGQYAIQLAKLSGFSPIIATASAQHTEYLKLLGATHVVPHSTSASEYSSLANETPITTAVLAISPPEHIATAIEVLTASANAHPSSSPPILNMSAPALFAKAAQMAAAATCEPKIQVSFMLGSPYIPRPGIPEFYAKAYAALECYLAQDDVIVTCRTKLIDGGLEGVVGKDGLPSIAPGTTGVSGVKLIVHV
ncbi:GroES-like protein [Clavulina sp. PMI_390]|nr:GroES-like protein [Clavulina sp. PMI_390]